MVPGGGTFSTAFSLPEDLATGTYTVTAGKGSTTATTNLLVTALPPIQLGTPAKPSLSDGIATWTAVANENNGYSLKLYKDGSLAGNPIGIAHGAVLSYYFSTAMTAGGSYTVAVIALGSGKYVNSNASPESAPQVVVIKATGVSLNAIGINLLVANSQTLTTAVTPSGASNQTVTWSSNNTDVAAIDTNGKVTGIAAAIAVAEAILLQLSMPLFRERAQQQAPCRSLSIRITAVQRWNWVLNKVIFLPKEKIRLFPYLLSPE